MKNFFLFLAAANFALCVTNIWLWTLVEDGSNLVVGIVNGLAMVAAIVLAVIISRGENEK